MHHGYEDELCEVMNKLFQERFNTSNVIGIKVKKYPHPKSNTLPDCLQLTKPDAPLGLCEIVNGMNARYEVALEAFKANK